MTMLYKKKVHAYITREKEGVMQLLVFKHRDIREAGIQVPGGTVDEGETLEAQFYVKYKKSQDYAIFVSSASFLITLFI